MSSNNLLTNADGIVLANSANATNYGLVPVSDTINGGAGADWLQSTSSGQTLIGGGGDDTYVVGQGSKVIENANGGTDTVYSFLPYYHLTDNVENLVVGGANGNWGEGNALANIISAGSGDAVLDGGAGDDILIAGSGHDTFIVRAGNGSDVIDGFKTGANGDALRLDNYGFHTFADVAAAATQVGSDTVIHLSATENLTLRDTHLADLTAANFQAPASDPSNMTLTFDDEFNSFSMWDPTTGKGTWRTSYDYADSNNIGSRTLPSNGEKQIYVDPTFTGTSDHPLGLNPFTDTDGVLDIHATRVSSDPASAAVAGDLSGYQWTSGIITTKETFAQQYGYFEISANVPSGQGLWPALWLLPANGTWPPEIDMLESIGDGSSAHETSHSNSTNFNATDSTASHVYATESGFHTYGLSWTADTLTWYIDGAQVKTMATPSDMQQPMYLLLNMSVGGSWPGDPDATTPNDSVFGIDYVRVYSSDPHAVAVPMQASTDAPAAAATASTDAAASTVTTAVVDTAPAPVDTHATDTTPATTPTPVVTVDAPTEATVHADTAPAAAPVDTTPVDTTPMVTVEGAGWVDGTGGHKTLVGTADSNYYWVTDSTDVVVAHAGANDTVMSTVDWTLGANTNRLLLQGSADLTAHANDAGNTISGNAGSDHLYGGAGNDYLDDNGGGGTVGTFMAGGQGDDTYVVNNAADHLTENAGGGYDSVLSTVSWTLGADFEKLQLQGSANIDAHGNDAGNTLIGNAGDNHIFGGAGSDYIDAGAGNDVIDGGGGDDYLVGGAGADTFVFRPGTGHATIADLNLGEGDFIDLTAFHGLSHTLTQVGGNAVIDLGGGENVTLVGVSAVDPLLQAHIHWG